jgi:NAD+ synthase (glutamine-hydrolysing)
VKVALAQLDSRIGDFAGNGARILAAITEAARQGAELVVLPELAISGYPPRDLLWDARFVARAVATEVELAAALGPTLPAVLFGNVHPATTSEPRHPSLWNVARLLVDRRATTVAVKRLLPSEDVFFEGRWFLAGVASTPFSLSGHPLGAMVCADLWDAGHPVHPAAELVAAGAAALLVPAASPYRQGVLDRRLHHARRAARPVVWVNAVGGQDELIFDGASFVMQAGELLVRLPRFTEAVVTVDVPLGDAGTSPASLPDPAPGSWTLDHAAEQFHALVLGIRSFARKNSLPRLFLGLSGGVDSAVVACLATAAVGPDAVTALALPSRHTDPRSTAAAHELAASLGIELVEVPVEPLVDAARATVRALLDDSPAAAITDQNLQARLRMVILAAHVNRRGGLLLNTSNKSELALGYGTTWGDLAGTLSPIGDLDKTEVVAMAAWLAAERGWIPAFTRERAPSAELAADQVDPFDYPRIAPLLGALVAQTPLGNDPEIPRLFRLFHAGEHKRWHHGIILKVSEHAFGSGRLMPITRAG